MNEELLDCIDDINSQHQSNIMVIGVGGGGSNAVRYMYDIGIHNVFFMVCNTDAQALRRSPIPLKIQLGSKLTNGLGAGNQPDKGRDAAVESCDEIKEQLISSKAKMVFITAGMGGGTGTGAAPVIAELAKELGILTVGIVTIPFRIEGPRRLKQAENGLNEIKKHVDSLIVIDNENICKMYGDLDFSDAFGKADDILAIAAKGIAEAITKEHKVNVDFADVQSTMSNSGIALLGYSSSELGGNDIAIDLTERALQSPLLNQNNIHGAQDILINISWNQRELKMNEVHAIISHVQAAAGSLSNIIWGAGVDSTLQEGEVSIIIIATGFNNAAPIELSTGITTTNFSVGKKGELLTSEALKESGKVIVEEVEKEQPQQQVAQPAEPAQPTAAAEEPKAVKVSQTEYFSLDDVVEEEKKEEVKPAAEDDGGMTLSEKVEVVSTPTTAVEVVTPAPVAEPAPAVVVEKKEVEKVAVAPQPAVENKISEYTIDELENMPAYKRRNMTAQVKTEANKSLERIKMD